MPARRPTLCLVSKIGTTWKLQKLLRKSQGDTEVELNFATCSDLSVETKDKVYKSKALRGIWTLIRHMIDTFRNTAADLCQKLSIKLSHCLILGSCSVNHGFLDSNFEAWC